MRKRGSLRSVGWWFVPVSMALFALALLLDTASAGECGATCRETRVTCVDAAKMAKRSCKEECRADAGGPGCFAGCRESYVEARELCSNTVLGCREECRKPCQPGAEDCVAGCVADLRACMGDVREEGKSCAKDCARAVETSVEDCFAEPDPLRCLVEHLRGLGDCLGGCAAGLRAGIAECTAGAEVCRELCSVGSASRAFLARPADLLE
ncbi:MAG: hypothetical protein AB1689_08495 [Thermodesulfobacteriota bacterium]